MNWLQSRSIKNALIGAFIIVITISVLGLKEYDTAKKNKALLRAEKQEVATSFKLALSDSISRYKNSEISTIDLSKTTPFSWDRLYVFGPYTDPQNIDKVVGENWRDTCTTSIESSDGIALLVFTTNGQAVQCIEYGRDNGDFASLDYGDGIPVTNAIFVLDDRGTVILASEK